ncbi:hypothetical protein TraAM80_04723 [Trypanosoma rangeli]|uniref:Uncharacterized protein n=1 Tax=Trypanosoma rangeli TaxID=5698 RepID=A0A3R7NN15_TRYRA|nr:uncharacterized protein TraAM80_04723 [Trypanosoma rangeli]RNF05077.1 hypothetical protein TraAM80_04723 [Trypanosoma rangeli]|eukprot:RNF05077.1 hypothetical protein TraAM80_04723 [Trypanosoma rangeli]
MALPLRSIERLPQKSWDTTKLCSTLVNTNVLICDAGIFSAAGPPKPLPREVSASFWQGFFFLDNEAASSATGKYLEGPPGLRQDPLRVINQTLLVQEETEQR